MSDKIIPDIFEELNTIEKSLRIIKARASGIADASKKAQTKESANNIKKRIDGATDDLLSSLWFYYEAITVTESGKPSQRPQYIIDKIGEAKP